MASLNHIAFRPLAAAKRVILKPGPQMREVKVGLLKGLNLRIDFRHQTQLYLGLYETETFEFCRKATERADWLVDLGAGGGELALYFMKVKGPNTVRAFEPLAAQRAMFAENLAANGWQQRDISISDRFVGGAPGRLPLDEMGLDLGKRGFVKIDVEGGEMDVLTSGAELLRSGAADFLIETHAKDLEDQCAALLKAHGYEVNVIPNAWWRIFVPEQRPTAHNRWLTAVHA